MINFFYIIFCASSIILSNELLFDDDDLFNGYGLAFGTNVMFGCNQCKAEGDRDIANLNSLNLSLLIKANHRINFYYYANSSDYQGFNLPDIVGGNYFQLGTQHFIKNKTPLNLDFDILSSYVFDSDKLYEKYILGFGVSKKIDSKDYQSFITARFSFYDYINKTNDIDVGDGGGWMLNIGYPIYMRVLPIDNKPSQFSYIFTPELILDFPKLESGWTKDLYLNFSFSVSYAL